MPSAIVTSAGAAAEPDYPACDLAAALITGSTDDETAAALTTTELAQHRCQLLSEEQLAAADPVLGLDRSHRTAIAKLHPAGRPRTFTLRQAAAAAKQVAASLGEGVLPEGAPPLPSDEAGRFAWWVAELDAARGLLPSGTEETVGTLVFDLHDVPDPHVVGDQYHPLAAEAVAAATDSVLRSLRLLVDFGVDAGSTRMAGQNGEAL